MKNDYHIGDVKISIPPTLLFSTIGKIEDVRKAVTMDAKRPGDLVYIIGETFPELGGSEWYAMHGYTGNHIPRVNAKKAKSLYNALTRAIAEGIVASCHDCSDGGLGISLAETAFAGGLGMSIDLSCVPCNRIDRDDTLLFSESQSRFIVTISPDVKDSFAEIMMEIPMGHIGTVTEEELFEIKGIHGNIIISECIYDLKVAWQKPLDF